MTFLSKSKLIAYRQCPKRLWLEVHRPELRTETAGTQASFRAGLQVGEVACRIYDAAGSGTTLDVGALGPARAIEETQQLLPLRKPIFEAGFRIGTSDAGALAFSDVLLPLADGSWRMVEVKSSTSVQPYYTDDAAIQYHVASAAGVAVSQVHLAHINSSWTYQGGGDYRGLLQEADLTASAITLRTDVERWIDAAHTVVQAERPPQMEIGRHCSVPFACGFTQHCKQEEVARHGPVEFPVSWLPGKKRKVLTEFLELHRTRSIEDVPDALVTAIQLRVKTRTLQREPYFDAAGAAAALAQYQLPALFLDFETVSVPVPKWAGTRPYDKIPFQFSLHRVAANGELTHSGFLDLSGDDPSERIAGALVASCGTSEPVFVYHASFEASCLELLAKRQPEYAERLRQIRARLVDLEPVAVRNYYHPDQQGSWSIKRVLPTIASELNYADLDEVNDGGAAQLAYLEAVDPSVSGTRRADLRDMLWKYCRLDTFAMVRLWGRFAGRERDIDLTVCISQEVFG